LAARDSRAAQSKLGSTASRPRPCPGQLGRRPAGGPGHENSRGPWQRVEMCCVGPVDPGSRRHDTASTRKTLYRKYLLFLPTSIPQTENSTDCTVHIHTTKSSSAFLAWCGTRSLLRPLHERPQKRKPWAQPTKRPLARRNQRERRATHQASKHKNTAATVTHRNNPITEDTAETYSSMN